MPTNYDIDNTDLKILERLGIVKGYTVELDYGKLGYDLTAFIGIYLQKSSLYDTVLEKLREIPEIVTIHYTTGNYSIFCKIYCRDTMHLKDVRKLFLK